MVNLANKLMPELFRNSSPVRSSVTAAGAVASTGADAHQVVNGENYTLYTLGSSGASVLIDDDINVNITV